MIIVDRDGKEIRLVEAVKFDEHGNLVYKWGQVSQKMEQVLADIMKTPEGVAYLSKFAKAGQIIGGHLFEQNGEFHDQQFVFVDVSLRERDLGDRSNVPYFVEGFYDSRVSEGRVQAFVQVMTFMHGDKYDAGETTAHEAFLHGYQAENEMRAFKRGGKAAFDAERAKDPEGHKDHKALASKDAKHPGYRLYNAIRNALKKVDKNYEPAFEKGGEKKQ
ncbi:MAG: hypothetical protein IPJ76_15330 [Flavobacteriales bacterium]|nr:MAG: hypothetical protein IPJ76_15330 [Flavobacteriales bacterium]